MKNTALIIIDVQNAMFQESNPVYNGEHLLEQLQNVLYKARSSGCHVFYVQHNGKEGHPLASGSKGWGIHPAITPQEQDIVIQKNTPDSFHNTNLNVELKKKKIEHLILTGIQSEVCVDTTCRRAFSMNYEVTLVSDAHSTWPGSGLSAQQIIDHHNQTLRWFAQVVALNEIEFI
ncbi:cysteine hydrolase family protein [Falsibacillus pallidus]|uniref:Nicotinamidase-related amidase n=1 Tax=Falsibacillus pallidus TaxID=493781 RepID=A0A370GPR0_9BACI|nr:cysteine hydrolase family protein [Falsibacillus pallidus]RDI45511.1 nicotinamidase-related amidase [Falsibacillus pallidus]